MMGNVYKHTIVLPASSNNYAHSFITLFKDWLLGLDIGASIVDEYYNDTMAQSFICSLVFSTAQQVGQNIVVRAYMAGNALTAHIGYGDISDAPLNYNDSIGYIYCLTTVSATTSKNIDVVCVNSSRIFAIGFNHTIFSAYCLCFIKGKTLVEAESFVISHNTNIYLTDGTLLGAQGSILGNVAQDNADSIAVMANAVIKSGSTITHYLTDVYSHLPNNMVSGCIYKIGNDDYYKDGDYLIKL